MAQIVGHIPEFTGDNASPEQVVEEVKEPVAEAPVTETDTPAPPAEKPASELASEAPVVPPQEDIDRAKAGLQQELVNLRKEVSELRGQRRELKQEEIAKAEKQLDDLKDLHPEDVTVIDRVLRAKGFVTKEEATKMFYESVKNEELSKFLDKYPEYKPENDPSDANWGALQKELGFYRTPSDPHQVQTILERAHRAIARVPSAAIPPKQRAIALASVGSGGTQRSAARPNASLDPQRRAMLQQGGFTEEDIKQIETNLS